MRIPDLAAVQRLVDNEVEESGVLDYKQELLLGTRTQKREFLRDLTAMGNAGGGTLIYGVREAEGRDGIPEEIAPLSDPSLPLVVADIIRDTVSPPLLFRQAVHDVAGGFVLVIDVELGTLGPYMVTGFDEHRYYKRHGKSSPPMSELEVRDAYELAARSSERMAARWDERAFPLRSRTASSSITTSAVPLEPATDILDLGTLGLGALRPPAPIEDYLCHGGLNSVIRGLRLWAGGYTYEPQPTPTTLQDTYAAMRVHRDGSIGITEAVGPNLEIGPLLRMLSGQLAYAGWLWIQFGLRRPVELSVQLLGLDQCRIPHHLGSTSLLTPVQPVGLVVSKLPLSQQVLPWDIARAPIRHRILDLFSDHLVQAFGRLRYDDGFRRGWLYGRDATTLPYVLHGGGIAHGNSGPLVAAIDEVGAVRNNVSQIVAYVVDGVVLDTEGNAVAVLEFAPGSGCPNDFFARETKLDFDLTTVPLRPSQPTTTSPPAPTGSWSQHTLAEVIRQI